VSRVALHGYVSGRVQGVSYRAFVLAQAQQHALTGWTRNVADGRVEVLLCGEEAAVDAVVAALHRGPPLAHVIEVALSAIDPSNDTDFTIRY
jgi:acylphosphatase